MGSFKFLIGTITIAILAACGGGGTSGVSTPATPATSETTYQAVATQGELISYTVDTTALTYSYRIVESAYGKNGITGNGQLTRNSDGTYTPSGFRGKIVVLDSGLMLGAIYEDLNGDGTREIVPIIGVSNPITSVSDAAGTYNFVSRQCGNACINYFGTVKVNTDGTWISCVGGNLAASTYSCQSSVSGSVSSFSSGRATLNANGVAGGSMLIFKDPSTNQKVVLLDLNGASSLGKGAVFAASQSLPASADGNWAYIDTDGNKGVVTVTGNNFSDSGTLISGINYGPFIGSFTANQPWNGFITTNQGGIIMPAGSGLYAAYFGAQNYMSVGVKR